MDIILAPVDDHDHGRERVLPTGTVELVIGLGADPLRVYGGEHGQTAHEAPSLVCGAHSGHFAIDAAGSVLTVGVHFRPGGAFPFFGAPADALADTHVPLALLWGDGPAAELRERLGDAPGHEARFRVLEQVLRARLADPEASHLAVRFALRELRARSGSGTIRDVVERVGISHRRFAELFRREVGLTPKVFWRIQRFQDALRLREGDDDIDWGRVALACGYFDQAHFGHDFRAFSGLTPSAYLRLRTEHLNHTRVDAH